MTRRHGRSLGLPLRLAAVAVGVIWIVVFVAAVITNGQLHELIRNQQVGIADAAALAIGDTREQVGWSRADLGPVIDLTGKEGVAVQVRDEAGRLVGSSPGFRGFPARAERTLPISAAGRLVGSVTVKFGSGDLSGTVDHFATAQMRGQMAAAAAGSVVAVLLAALAASWIRRPVNRLRATSRARGSGDRTARFGDVGGFHEIYQLAKTLDEMADSFDAEERVWRNLIMDIAHDLRTPITVLQASGEAMLDGMLTPTRENLESYRRELARLERMVDDLQRLASAGAAALQLTLAPSDLAAVAGSVASHLADVFGAAGVSLVQELSSVWVMCDPRRLEDITTNLLTNAVKFTAAGGEVTLETASAGHLAMLRVSDTGVGISPDDLPHVRERFFRGQRSGEVPGSGIGLAIVDELVRAQRGTLEITSELGVGTKVTVTFQRLAGAEPG